MPTLTIRALVHNTMQISSLDMINPVLLNQDILSTQRTMLQAARSVPTLGKHSSSAPEPTRLEGHSNHRCPTMLAVQALDMEGIRHKRKHLASSLPATVGSPPEALSQDPRTSNSSKRRTEMWADINRRIRATRHSRRHLRWGAWPASPTNLIR